MVIKLNLLIYFFHSNVYSSDFIMATLLFHALRMTERKFNLAYNQVRLLDAKIDALNKRHDRAKDREQKKFCYSLRLQLSVMEGTRNMYYEYVQRMAFTLDALQKNAGLIDVEMDSDECLTDFSDDEDDSDDIWVREQGDGGHLGDSTVASDALSSEPAPYASISVTRVSEPVIDDGVVYDGEAIVNETDQCERVVTHESNNCYGSPFGSHLNPLVYPSPTDESLRYLYCDESLLFMQSHGSATITDINENVTYNSGTSSEGNEVLIEQYAPQGFIVSSAMQFSPLSQGYDDSQCDVTPMDLSNDQANIL